NVQADCGSSNLSAFSALNNFTTLTPSCGTPTGVGSTNITSNSVTLIWAAVVGALSYNIEYRNVSNPVWTTATSATNSLNIFSLSPSTSYEWHVQAVCALSQSSFSVHDVFTTLPSSCGVPTGLLTTNITAASATLNWNAVTGATTYNVRYRQV